MIKIKIIDLLNKIANGEIEENIKYKFSQSDYCSVREFFNRYFMDRENLNIEVETNEDKKIEKINIISDEAAPNSYYILNDYGTKCYLTKHSKVIIDKVNEIIDYINKE